MLANEFYEGRRVRLPVCRKTLKIFEDRVDAGFLEESDRVLGIFVEVSIEYALVHEIGIAADVEENPSQVVKLEGGKNERIARYGVLYRFSVGADLSSRPGLIFAMIVNP
jgi:hypothetical protein